MPLVGLAPTTDQAGIVLTPEQKAALRDRIRNRPPKTDPAPQPTRITAHNGTLSDAIRTAVRGRLQVPNLPDIDTEHTPDRHDDLEEAQAAVDRMMRTPEDERGVEWQVRYDAACGVVTRLTRDRELQQRMANERQMSDMLSGWHQP